MNKRVKIDIFYKNRIKLLQIYILSIIFIITKRFQMHILQKYAVHNLCIQNM